VTELTALFKSVKITDEEEKIEAIIQALQAPYCRVIARAKPNTFKEALKTAQEAEQS
jgi:hypothetical protein